MSASSQQRRLERSVELVGRGLEFVPVRWPVAQHAQQLAQDIRATRQVAQFFGAPSAFNIWPSRIAPLTLKLSTSLAASKSAWQQQPCHREKHHRRRAGQMLFRDRHVERLRAICINVFLTTMIDVS